jgi:hypothetical protein
MFLGMYSIILLIFFIAIVCGLIAYIPITYRSIGIGIEKDRFGTDRNHTDRNTNHFFDTNTDLFSFRLHTEWYDSDRFRSVYVTLFGFVSLTTVQSLFLV